jgi:hypothetical protein
VTIWSKDRQWKTRIPRRYGVKFTSTTAKAAIAGAGLAAIGVFAAATAAGAPPTIQQFGISEQLVDGRPDGYRLHGEQSAAG